MLKGPDLFRAYVLVAATDVLGLGYTRDKDFVDEIVQAAARGALNNKYLYVASAKFQARREPRHEINAQKLRQGLVPYVDKMKFKIEHIDHFGHYPVAIPAITNGLNLIFPRKDFQMFQKLGRTPSQTIPKIVEHYNELSKHYGVTINIPTDITRNPNSLRSIGYKLLKRQDYDQAIEAFLLWTQISDKDPNAHFWLSRVFAAKGALKEAIASVEKSIALSRDYTPNNTGYLKNVLEKYKTQLNDD